jgi:hypothetical protein
MFDFMYDIPTTQLAICCSPPPTTNSGLPEACPYALDQITGDCLP